MSAPTVHVPECTDRVHVYPFDDPVVERHGYHVTSRYAEMYWLPIIGPTTLWMARRLADFARGCSPDDCGAVDLVELAKCLGLGGTGRNAPVRRTLDRLCRFHFAAAAGYIGDETQRRYGVREWVPPLTGPQLRRLPSSLLILHETFGGDV